jgi:hypothetical protein
MADMYTEALRKFIDEIEVMSPEAFKARHQVSQTDEGPSIAEFFGDLQKQVYKEDVYKPLLTLGNFFNFETKSTLTVSDKKIDSMMVDYVDDLVSDEYDLAA